MPEDFLHISDLADRIRAWAPYALGAAAFVLVAFRALRSGRQRSRRSRPTRWRRPAGKPVGATSASTRQSRPPGPQPDLGDPNVQIRYVLNARYRRRRLMNPSEYAVFAQVRELLAELGGGHHAFPQVPLRAVLQTDCEYASRAVGAKRLDLLVVDRGGQPVAAVEYQGGGHFQGDAMQRDRVKRVALERAGIPLIELYQGFSPADLRRDLGQALGSSRPATARATAGPERSARPSGPWSRPGPT